MTKEFNSKTFIATTLLYATTSLLCLWISRLVNVTLIFWIPSAIAISVGIVHGNKTILPILTGSIILLVFSYINLKPFDFSPLKISILSLSDTISAAAIAFYYKRTPPFLNNIRDLKKYAIVVLASSAVQSTIITGAFILFGLNASLNFTSTFNSVFIAIAISLITLLPFVLWLQTKINTSNAKSHLYVTTVALAILPNIINLIGLSALPNAFPIQLAIITFLIVFAVKQRFELAIIFISVYSISLTINTTISRNFFSFYDFPNNITNAQYFSLLISLLAITINAILNERNNALQAISNSYTDVQNEVNRQTSILKELNNRLVWEIERRGLVEKELTLSKKLLLESQEIANITSWEFDLKSKTIRWSESASRILGIEPEEVNALSMDKFIEKIHPDDKRPFKNAILQASDKLANIDIEIKYYLNNRYRNIRILCRSFKEEELIERIVGVLSDITDWKEVQLALTEKEIRYQALFETNIDPVILIDAKTKNIIEVNTAFEKLYGYSKSEIIETPYMSLSAQSYETHLAIEIALEKGSYRVPSRIHRKKSGEEFFIEGHFVKFMSGNTPLVFAMVRDNTIRKNYEDKLSERELKFRLFFESNLIGMAETSIYKTWITFNTKLCSILGYKHHELEKITWDKITHPEDLDFELKQFNNILQHKTDNYNLEKRFIKKDGSIVNCNVAVKAIKDSSGNITHLVKLIEDTTLRRKAENALLESQNRLKKAQQIAHLGVCRLNMLSGYIDVSEEAFSILGWKKESAPFKLTAFTNSIHPSDRELLNTIIERLKNKEVEEENLEARFVKSTGDILYLTLNLGVAISNGKVTDLIITFANITTSKLAEASLKDANAMKDQLFSVISHDLRGPIGSMEQMLSVYMNSEESLDNEAKKEIISLLHNTAHESYNLLDNLLEWGRSQRQSAAKPSTVEIKEIVDETTMLLLSMASSKKILIEVTIEKDCKAFVDPMMLKTILRNLLTNSIKFTPAEGKISIKGTTKDKECIISITDSGIGIPEKKIKLLFDDSNTFSTVGTNNEKGTGLGLKLVKRFVDKNEGTLTVQSNQGDGTTFIISFPATQSTSSN